MATNAFTFGPVLDAVLAGVKIIETGQAALSQAVAGVAAVIGKNHAEIVQLLGSLEKQMAEDFTVLSQTLMDLQAQVAASGGELDALFQALQGAMSNGNQPAIDDAVAKIKAQIQVLKDAGTRDMPPAPPPPPPPPGP